MPVSVQESPADAWVGGGLLRGQGTECGSACRGPLEEVTINPTREPPELTQDWENRLLKGTNKALCTPEPRRKEQ